ncbi:hypothetical protein [Bogoriella caseilytica]|uniref:Uncharacterized protein n=1 Tax=Bogoriella caseilytica TaxID=56055 RepID=A0A3N2BGQ9_9MICO|nr:hypothetical protein [Bogoriella caseilytica]ROR74427.1 hypothetical protein EDD31_2843 [Bogoriella caseilytica]
MTDDTWLGFTEVQWTGLYTFFTGGLLLVAVVAALVAWAQVSAMREQRAEARRAAQEASRPYVIVTTEPTRVDRHLFDLVVKNIGRRPAHDVRVKLDPKPVRADERGGAVIGDVKMLNEPIAMIAPGQELRTFFDNSIEREERRGELPTSHRVHVTYSDSSKEVYDEESVLDLDALRDTMFAKEMTVHHLAKKLEKTNQLLARSPVINPRSALSVDATLYAPPFEDDEDQE